MVKLNAVVSVSDSNVPQQARKDNTIEFVKVLSQFPTYTYKGENGWFVAKEVCEKMGYRNPTQLINLVSDNKDEVVVLESDELKEFCDYNCIVTKSKTRYLTIIGPNAFLEIINRSTHPSFACLRAQSRDVLYRYIKGEEVSIKKDLEVEHKDRQAELCLKVMEYVGKAYSEDSMYFKRAVAVTANAINPNFALPLPAIEADEFILSADDVAKKLKAHGLQGFKGYPTTWGVNKNNIGKLRKDDSEIAKLSKEIITEGNHGNRSGVQEPNKQIKYSVKVVDYILNNY